MSWTSAGVDSGSGRFVVRDEHAAIFVGFATGAMPIDLGPVRIEKLITPFATILVTSAEPGKPIAQARRLLIAAVARGENEGMAWDAARHTISYHWGNAPPRVEPVRATLSVAARSTLTLYPLGPDGTHGRAVPAALDGSRCVLSLGEESTLWYEVDTAR